MLVGISERERERERERGTLLEEEGETLWNARGNQ